MTSKEKYLKRIAGQESDAIKEAKERVENRSWLRESKKLALKILIRLDELGWTQRTLSSELGVSPQYVNKLLKGNEKFGFDIIVKLQEVLDLPILYSYKKRENLDDKKSKEFRSFGVLIKADFNNKKSPVPQYMELAPIIEINPNYCDALEG
jgi:transcriptional regulator with XRE-family HTH domain